MTYLEIVNKVLVRLRERSVSTVAQNTYSAMVGEFVNDAKREVELAWEWGSNREIITVYTVVAETMYDLPSFGQFGKILSGWNQTSTRNMYEASQRGITQRNLAGIVTGAPYLYTYRGQDASQNVTLELYPEPDLVYELKLNVYRPQDELTADGTVLTIPWRPVVLLAAAMLAEEKGEAGGTTSARYFEMANKALSDAISIDANRYGTELTFVGV